MARPTLIPRPKKGNRKRAWFPLFAHVYRHHGPSICYTHDVEMDTQPYTYTCIIVPNTAYVVRDLDHTLSDAFKQLSAPEVIIKPEQ